MRDGNDRAVLLLLLALAALAAITFRDYGLGWDDYTHAQMGDLVLALYRSAFHDRRAFSFVNLFMYGSGFDVLAALAAKVLPFTLFETRRLVGALVGIAGIAVTWRIARRLGGTRAGFAAAILLAACPLYYGHMFVNPKDPPFAAAMALLLLALVRMFEEYPGPRASTVALFGLGLGLSVGSRIMAVIAGPIAAIPLFFLLGLEGRSLGWRAAIARFGRWLLWLVPGAILAYAVMAVIWPWSVLAPLNPLRAVEYFAHFFEKPWRELFNGVPVLVPDMPWSYLPTLLALKLPEIFTALALVGTAVAILGACRKEASPQRRAVLLVVVCAAFVPIAITLVTRPALYNGVRHFVFVLPPMAVLGGLAADRLLHWCSQRHRALQGALLAVLLVGVASPIIEMVRLHPYEYTHFNRLAGGVRGAEDRYMLDYWGLAFKQGGEALRAALAAHGETPPSARKWKIAVCGPHPPAAVALGPEFELTWDPKGADFALMSGEFYCRDLDAPVLATISREGVIYARAYDLRGHPVTELFTLPTP